MSKQKNKTKDSAGFQQEPRQEPKSDSAVTNQLPDPTSEPSVAANTETPTSPGELPKAAAAVKPNSKGKRKRSSSKAGKLANGKSPRKVPDADVAVAGIADGANQYGPAGKNAFLDPREVQSICEEWFSYHSANGDLESEITPLPLELNVHLNRLASRHTPKRMLSVVEDIVQILHAMAYSAEHPEIQECGQTLGMKGDNPTVNSHKKHGSVQPTPVPRDTQSTMDLATFRKDRAIESLLKQVFPKLYPGEMGIIFGGADSGHTALAVQSARANSTVNQTLYATFDLPPKECQRHFATALLQFGMHSRKLSQYFLLREDWSSGSFSSFIGNEISSLTRAHKSYEHFRVFDFTKSDDGVSEIERIKKMLAEEGQVTHSPLLIVDSLSGIEKQAVKRYGPWTSPEHRSEYLLKVVKDLRALAKASKTRIWILVDAGDNPSEEARRGLPFDPLTREIRKRVAVWFGLSEPEPDSDSGHRVMTFDPCDGTATLTRRIIVDFDFQRVWYRQPDDQSSEIEGRAPHLRSSNRVDLTLN